SPAAIDTIELAALAGRAGPTVGEVRRLSVKIGDGEAGLAVLGILIGRTRIDALATIARTGETGFIEVRPVAVLVATEWSRTGILRRGRLVQEYRIKKVFVDRRRKGPFWPHIVGVRDRALPAAAPPTVVKIQTPVGNTVVAGRVRRVHGRREIHVHFH